MKDASLLFWHMCIGRSNTVESVMTLTDWGGNKIYIMDTPAKYEVAFSWNSTS